MENTTHPFELQRQNDRVGWWKLIWAQRGFIRRRGKSRGKEGATDSAVSIRIIPWGADYYDKIVKAAKM